MIFKQRLWMIPIAHWTGLLSAAACVYAVTQGLHPAWLLLWALGHTFGGIAVSAGLHRYFTHGAFTTSRFWHVVLAFYATLTVQDSPLGWAAAHSTHHKHSDGAGDPHYTGLLYLVKKHYRQVPLVGWRVRHLVGDPVIAFVHRYALLIIATWVLALTAAGHAMGVGFAPLLFGYLAPLGSTHMFGAIHQVTSHRGGAARDLPWMEWIFPAAGEWMHKHHHDHPRDPRLGRRWWNLDYGWWFICMVRTDR